MFRAVGGEKCPVGVFFVFFALLLTCDIVILHVRTMSMPSQVSRIRQRIAQLAGERRDAERVLLQSPPLLKGSFIEVRRTCGHAGCKCARGEKHVCRQLSASVEGRARTWNVPQRYAAKVQRLTENYRRFRGARAVWVRANRQIVELINELEAARTVPGFCDESGSQKG